MLDLQFYLHLSLLIFLKYLLVFEHQIIIKSLLLDIGVFCYHLLSLTYDMYEFILCAFPLMRRLGWGKVQILIFIQLLPPLDDHYWWYSEHNWHFSQNFLPLRQCIWINININMETIVDYQQKLKSKNIHCTIPVWIAWSEKLQQSKFKLNAWKFAHIYFSTCWQLFWR